uniref:J domain-containing protein n=1 Tax=Tetradesmus obliquus TaxID=3088 RepID=A0A383WHG6_TETOB|eukprot:jgi/Sobl393_1/8290/SZX76927.1
MGKRTAAAQFAVIKELVNQHLRRIVQRDFENGTSSGASSSSNSQQQQPSVWQQQQQQRQLDTEAAAVPPDPEKMSAHALKEFLKQVKVDIPRGLTQREQLLELAKAAVQLWEAHRVLRCARIGQQHPSLELPAALAVFKQKSHAAGAAVTAAAEEAEKRALKKACRQLQLALHPDKTPQQLAGQQAVFVEAFKALQHAQQLVPALKT